MLNEQIIKISNLLKENGWNMIKDEKGFASSYSLLWLPPFDFSNEDSDFFFDYGLVTNPYSAYNKVQWVMVSKKIFRSLESYQSWRSRGFKQRLDLSKEVRAIDRKIKKLSKTKKKAGKNKLEILKLEKEKSLTWERVDRSKLVPDIDHCFSFGQIYYLCENVDYNEVFNSAKNNKLIETVLFNLDKFI